MCLYSIVLPVYVTKWLCPRSQLMFIRCEWSIQSSRTVAPCPSKLLSLCSPSVRVPSVRISTGAVDWGGDNSPQRTRRPRPVSRHAVAIVVGRAGPSFGTLLYSIPVSVVIPTILEAIYLRSALIPQSSLLMRIVLCTNFRSIRSCKLLLTFVLTWPLTLDRLVTYFWAEVRASLAHGA